MTKTSTAFALVGVAIPIFLGHRYSFRPAFK